jgi:hypothetical protein
VKNKENNGSPPKENDLTVNYVEDIKLDFGELQNEPSSFVQKNKPILEHAAPSSGSNSAPHHLNLHKEITF